MTLINFKKQFAPAVENKTKWQTIRKPRKIPFNVGEKLQLYTGLRTKNCRKLHDAISLSIQNVEIEAWPRHGGGNYIKIIVDGETLNYPADLRFAKADGFDSLNDFATFFKSMNLEKYQLIKWGLPFERLEIGKFYLDGHYNKYEIKDDEWGVFGAELISGQNTGMMCQMESFEVSGKWQNGGGETPDIENLILQVAP